MSVPSASNLAPLSLLPVTVSEQRGHSGSQQWAQVSVLWSLSCVRFFIFSSGKRSFPVLMVDCKHVRTPLISPFTSMAWGLMRTFHQRSTRSAARVTALEMKLRWHSDNGNMSPGINRWKHVTRSVTLQETSPLITESLFTFGLLQTLKALAFSESTGARPS